VIYLKKFPANKTGTSGVWQISRAVLDTTLASRTQVQGMEAMRILFCSLLIAMLSRPAFRQMQSTDPAGFLFPAANLLYQP
jgi:threonine/homoserine efflux transporter RhtA